MEIYYLESLMSDEETSTFINENSQSGESTSVPQENPNLEEKESNEEIDLNLLFPEEEMDLNELFQDQETKTLLKKINKNKKDLGKIESRFLENKEDQENSSEEKDIR